MESFNNRILLLYGNGHFFTARSATWNPGHLRNSRGDIAVEVILLYRGVSKSLVAWVVDGTLRLDPDRSSVLPLRAIDGFIGYRIEMRPFLEGPMTLVQSAEPLNDFTGLKVLEFGLPVPWYYELKHYELELARIWYRNWVYVGNSSEVPSSRSYRTFELHDQKILLVRDQFGKLHGYHNTCRHRGAELCPSGFGVLNSSTLICPYHAWVYDLQGALLRTSSKSVPRGFRNDDFGLYTVNVTEWRGLIFVALGENPPSFVDSVANELRILQRWPLEEMVVAHVATKNIRCNWKVFWENFNECLHCPVVHPKLSQMVPIFGRGLLMDRDDPKWREHKDDPDPRYRGGIRADAKTLSMDGRITGHELPTLTEQERRAGVTYGMSLPSMFIAAHVDHVRVVRVLPLGPEQMELRSEYLFASDVAASEDFDPRNVVEFANMVMTEDANVCEINQRGLRSRRHEAGALMPEEYLLKEFHDWIRAALT